MMYSTIVLAASMAITASAAFGQEALTSNSTPANLPSGTAGEQTPSLQARNPRYQLRKGDSFDVDFTFSSEFNQTVSVQPDGYVTLTDVGSMYVEGRTVPELTEALKEAYAKILREPVITVALKDFEKPYFIASGQVTKPGKYDLRGPLTVTEAVAIAGGFNDKAKHSQVVLFRPVPGGGYEATLLNVKKLLATRNLSEDPQLHPGDMLYVPQSAMSKIRPFLPTSSMGAYLGSGVL
jgi:polysaccharide export outer membrane protein